jgi:hypothetical protein
MRKYLLGAALLSVLAVSCKKDKDMVKATVIDTGDIATGGCGYIIMLEEDKRELKPIYLPSAYQHDGYKVKVEYSSNGEQGVCTTHPISAVYEIVEIKDIKRDLD